MSTVTTTFGSAASAADSSNTFYAFVLGLIVLVVFLFREKQNDRNHLVNGMHHTMWGGFPRILGVVPTGWNGGNGVNGGPNDQNNQNNWYNRLCETLTQYIEADFAYKTELCKKWTAEDAAVAKQHAAEDSASAAKKLLIETDTQLQTVKAELSALRATSQAKPTEQMVRACRTDNCESCPMVPANQERVVHGAASIATSTSTSTSTSALSGSASTQVLGK